MRGPGLKLTESLLVPMSLSFLAVSSKRENLEEVWRKTRRMKEKGGGWRNDGVLVAGVREEAGGGASNGIVGSGREGNRGRTSHDISEVMLWVSLVRREEHERIGVRCISREVRRCHPSRWIGSGSCFGGCSLASVEIWTTALKCGSRD